MIVINFCKTIILLQIILFVTGCNNNLPEEIRRMPDEFERIPFSLDSIATDLLIVPFSDDVPIENSMYIKWHDSYYYFSNPLPGKLFRFNDKGKYIDVLDKKGRGAKEYANLGDFFVDDNSNIYVSNNIDRIVVYNSNYTHIRDIMYPYKKEGVLNIRLLNNKIHLFYFNYTGDGYSWAMVDTLGNLLDSTPVIDKYEYFIRSQDIQLFYNNGKLYRYFNRNDTIYEFDSLGFKPYRLINRQFNDGFNLVVYNAIPNPPQLLQTPHRVVTGIFGIGDYWLMKLRKYHLERDFTEEETILYDYRINKSYLVNSDVAKKGKKTNYGLLNDWVGWGSISPREIIEIDGIKHLVYPIEAFDFLEYVNSKEFAEAIPKRPEIKQRFREIADTLTMEDNPVLILLKLK